MDAKNEGKTRVEAWDECTCEPCKDLVETVSTCIKDNCVPDCVKETSRAYFQCASKPRYGCYETCQATIEDISSELLSNVQDNTMENVTLREALFNLEVVQKVQDENLELTCENIETKFYATPACTLGNCCPYCVDEFEDMAACAVNTALAFVETESGAATDGDNDEDAGCEFDCGDNVQFEGGNGMMGDGVNGGVSQTRGGGGGGDGGARRRLGERHLQSDTDIVVPERVENMFVMCREEMSNALAVGESASAADNFLNCAIGASLPNLKDGVDDDDGTATDGDSTGSGGASESGAVEYVASSFKYLVLSYFGMMIIYMFI